MSYNILLEDMIRDVGGCGRFQWIMSVIGQSSKSIAAWSMLAMTFNGQQPDFMCRSSSKQEENFDNVCSPENITECDGYVFSDDMNTVVNEWNLVCDTKWIAALITTIQMSGVLVGCFISGHLGDLLGRKPTFFLSLLILIVFNVVAYFSVNWQMYSAIRFVLGMGIGFFLTVHYNVMTEFALSRWRPRIVAVPAWALEAGLFALAAWALKDWKKLHLVTAAIGVPFLLTYCFVQESARWLVTKGRYDDAEKVIYTIAKLNGKPKPDTSRIMEEAAKSDSDRMTTHYTALHLFKTRELVKITTGLLFIWMSISYSYYGLTFGVNSLAGNLYLNMFLMNIIEAPASFSIMYIVNRFGRKHCCIFFFMFTGLCGVVVGIIQYVDTPHRGVVTNAFALASKMGIACGWGCLIVYTTELYPTVVRTIAYGLHNTSARIGGMVAPQIVFLNDDIPGLMYFLSAVLMIASSLICCLFPDTKDKILEDTFKTDQKKASFTVEMTVDAHSANKHLEKNNTKL
ncbi:solute carrier family 22 member 4-like isoform X3 [Mercenaria mercenaria]|uniref:solute carrier family 22 member 4-like isoform X3 n=1 Tax=Mercenaria mercenaria TaxID=6596 RepID=UPI00234E8E5A|nr:solute carrier family 22 member 4-like isoform X3 [Mercenaria mercenaria]